MPEVLCPECMTVSGYDVVERSDAFDIRGDTVIVDATIAVCRKCGEEIGVASLDDDTFRRAYAVYRARHDLLQPEHIHAIRSKYGLGQKAFARLLGWGDVTLARYETGSLQSAAHDSTLRLAEDPDNVRQLLALNGDRLSAKQRRTLAERLDDLSEAHEAVLAREEAAAYGMPIGVRRLREMIVFFAECPGTWRTKLNKLLFYADFLHHKRHGAAISGARYVRMQFGPVPADFYALHGLLVDDASIDEIPATCGECDGTVFVALRPADRALFSEDELRTMTDVAEHFDSWTAGRISEFSHREPAWAEARDRETIPYERSRSLLLS